jgi:hypothetical protein
VGGAGGEAVGGAGGEAAGGAGGQDGVGGAGGAGGAEQRVLRVCPDGCEFALPSEAAAVVEDGDLVEIEAADYVDCAVWRASVTVRGVGGRPHIRDRACADKGIFITRGETTRFENLEFSGMAVPDENGAGIRHEGTHLVVRDVRMHDGEQGILAGDNPAGTVYIENSRFERLGRNGQAHGIYINRVAELRIRDSRFLRSVDQGHEIKSRALRTLIDCSVIASLDGDDSRNIDLPEGGHVEIRNSVIQQGEESPQRNIIGFNLEEPAHETQRLIMRNNLLINDQDRGSFVHIDGEPELDIRDNIFVGAGQIRVGGAPFPNNVYLNSREDAMVPPGPSVPQPRACADEMAGMMEMEEAP